MKRSEFNTIKEEFVDAMLNIAKKSINNLKELPTIFFTLNPPKDPNKLGVIRFLDESSKLMEFGSDFKGIVVLSLKETIKRDNSYILCTITEGTAYEVPKDVIKTEDDAINAITDENRIATRALLVSFETFDEEKNFVFKIEEDNSNNLYLIDVKPEEPKWTNKNDLQGTFQNIITTDFRNLEED